MNNLIPLNATTTSTIPYFIGAGVVRPGDETTIRAFLGRTTAGVATLRVRDSDNHGVDLLVATSSAAPTLLTIGVVPPVVGNRTLEYFLSISDPLGEAIVGYVLEEESVSSDRNPAYSPQVMDASEIGKAAAPSVSPLNPRIIQTRKRK